MGASFLRGAKTLGQGGVYTTQACFLLLPHIAFPFCSLHTRCSLSRLLTLQPAFAMCPLRQLCTENL